MVAAAERVVALTVAALRAAAECYHHPLLSRSSWQRSRMRQWKRSA